MLIPGVRDFLFMERKKSPAPFIKKNIRILFFQTTGTTFYWAPR